MKDAKNNSKVMNTKKLKREWVEGKSINIKEDPLDHIPKKIKYNEEIDLTKEIPEIVVDLTVKRKRKAPSSVESDQFPSIPVYPT
jgi:hypothetical protein